MPKHPLKQKAPVQKLNVDDVLQKFVSDNFEKLTSPEINLSRYREIERDHFNQSTLRNRVQRPGVRQTIDALYKVLFRRGIPRETVLEYIESLPLFAFSGENYRRELLAKAQTAKETTGLQGDHLALIRTVGYFEAAKDVAKQAAIEESSEKLKEIDAAIKLKQEDYASLPSILDHESQEERPFDPQVEDIKPWWERFYLKGDPFPRKDGLSDIGEELYDAVTFRHPDNPNYKDLGKQVALEIVHHLKTFTDNNPCPTHGTNIVSGNPIVGDLQNIVTVDVSFCCEHYRSLMESARTYLDDRLQSQGSDGLLSEPHSE